MPYTPTPWTLVEKFSGSENHKGWSLYGTIRPEHGGDGEERCWIADISPVIINDGEASDDGKGNAALFLAATDLLEALTAFEREASSWHETHKDNDTTKCDSLCECLPAARAAIAKATGAQHGGGAA